MLGAINRVTLCILFCIIYVIQIMNKKSIRSKTKIFYSISQIKEYENANKSTAH